MEDDYSFAFPTSSSNNSVNLMLLPVMIETIMLFPFFTITFHSFNQSVAFNYSVHLTITAD